MRAWNARPANPSSLRTTPRPAASASFLTSQLPTTRSCGRKIVSIGGPTTSCVCVLTM